MSDSPLSMNLYAEDWLKRPLIKVSEFIKDGTHGTHERVNIGVPLLSAKNITSYGSITIDEEDSRISNDDYQKIHSKYEIQKNDLLITVVGTLGRRALADGVHKFSIQRSVGVVRCDTTKIFPEFLYHFTGSDYFQNQLTLRSNATAQAGVYLGELAKIDIAIPPLPEQQKIATILTSVDTVIEKTRAQIDKLKHLKTGMMQELLTKGIGHTEFKDTPVGRIPKIWNIYTAQELLNSKTLLKLQDGNHGSQYPRALDFVSSGVPYIAASHISETGEINFNNCPHLSQKHANELRIRPAMGGDVILTHNATVGRAAIIPDDRNEVIASTSTTYYRTNNAKLLNRYLYYYFQSTSYISQLLSIMGQTTRNQVPITTQRELLIIIPPIQEQIILADTIEVVAHNIKAKCEKLDSLILLKKALMQDLLTGNKRTHAF